MQHHSLNRAPLALLGIAFLAGALGAGCIRSHRSEPEASKQASAPPAEARPKEITGSVLDPLTRGWELGRAYVYEAKVTTKIAFSETANSFDFDHLGTLELSPFAATPETVSLFATVTGAKFVSRVPGTQAEFDKVSSQLKENGAVFVLSGGRLEALYLPRGLQAMAANLYRTLGAALQFSRPKEPALSYSFTEFDTTGEYLADYAQESEPNVFRKRKQRYLALLTPKAAAGSLPPRLLPLVASSEGEVRLGDDGRPASVTSHEELVIKGSQAPVRSETTVTLQSRSSREARLAFALDDSKMERVAASEAYGQAVDEGALDRARINGQSFEKIVARLEQLSKHPLRDLAEGSTVNDQPPAPKEQAEAKNDVSERSQLFIALAAMFRQQPETVRRAVAKIRAQSPASDVLVDALGSAASPEAQAALVGLLAADAGGEARRRSVAVSLSRTSKPTERSMTALMALADDPTLGVQALYGLGTYSRRLREAGRIDESNRIGQFLVERVEAAKTVSPLLTALRAVANAGYAPALPLVVNHLTDPREQVRVAATRALQSMPDAKVDELLVATLKTDSATSVRTSALDSAQVRRPNDVLARGVAEAATTAIEPHVRYRAVQLLIKWLPERPELRLSLEHVAKSDKEEQIRQRAKAAL